MFYENDASPSHNPSRRGNIKFLQAKVGMGDSQDASLRALLRVTSVGLEAALADTLNHLMSGLENLVVDEESFM